MIEVNLGYEKEIKSIIKQYGAHWRKALESKGTDPKRHGPNRQHLVDYILARTQFLDNVETNFKTRVVACLHHMTEVPHCKNPKCGKPLLKYLIDNAVEENPRETMFCSSKCVYEARESIEDTYVHFDKRCSTVQDKKEFLRKLIADYPLTYQRVLQGKDYKEVAAWIYDAVPKLQAACYNTATRLYWILNGLEDFPTCQCQDCANKVGVGKNVKITQGYNPYCSRQCAAKSELTKQHLKETFIEKYGVDNPWKSDSVKQTITQTFINKWGETCGAHVHEIVSKARKNIVYNGLSFASKPELAYYIWLKDNCVDFIYHPKIKLTYYDMNGGLHYYYPDFLVNGELQEIKGDHFFKKDGKMFAAWKPKGISQEKRDFLDDKEERKHQCMLQNSVKILRGADYKVFLNYVSEKYGDDFLDSFKNKR